MSFKHHYYYNVMRKTILQFIDIFNDLVVARYNDNGQVIKYVKVPVKFAPKTKQWYWEELRKNNDRRDHVLPMISIDLDNVEFDIERQVNRNLKVPIINDGKGVKTYFNPIPYDLTFRVQIASEYIVDAMQLNEQILPFFMPESWIRITIPELDITGINDGNTDKLELRVVYEGSDNDVQTELEESGYRVVLWTHNFRVKGYLFSPYYEEGGIVNKVIQSYYMNDVAWETKEDDLGNMYFERGGATLQGVSYATNIPTDGTKVDDTIRSMWKYEHYAKGCDAILYSVPPSGDYPYPLSVELKSNQSIREIWYSLTEVDNDYIITEDDNFIMVDGSFIVITSDETAYPMTKYWRPILIEETKVDTLFITDDDGDFITENSDKITIPLEDLTHQVRFDNRNLKSYVIRFLGVGIDGGTTRLYTSIYNPLIT